MGNVYILVLTCFDMKTEKEIIKKIGEAKASELENRRLKMYHGASDWANFRIALEWVLEE